MKPVVALTFSNSEDDPLFSIYRESQLIFDLPFPLHVGGAIQLFREDSLDLEGVIQIFNRFEDRIYVFHFGGHGGGDNLLLGKRTIPREKFVALLGAQKNKAKLVFLNSSSSKDMVNDLLDAGIMAVIAAESPIHDTEATEFARSFYEYLSKGESIKKSYDFARNTVFPSEMKEESGLSRGITLGFEPVDLCPYNLFVKEETEDILDWKLPLLTTTKIIKKPALIFQSETKKYISSEEERKLDDILFALQDQSGIELYKEKNRIGEDSIAPFKRFEQQVFLYHFHGSEECPLFRYLLDASEEKVIWIKSQLQNLKVIILNCPCSMAQIEILLNLGVQAIIYSWYIQEKELRDSKTQSWDLRKQSEDWLKLAAKFYEFLMEDEPLWNAYQKAAQYIWTITDLLESPPIIAYDSEQAELASEPVNQPQWGLYYKRGNTNILDWKCPKPLFRGIRLDNLSEHAIPSGKNYLLAIGIDKYRGGIPVLNNAVKDARNFCRILTNHYRFEAANVYTLFNRKATLKNILKTFDKLLKEITPEDNIVLYFSGHGIIHKPTRRGYWLPVNAKVDDRSTYLSNADVLDFINHVKARHFLGIVDSCFSGSLFQVQRNLDKITEYSYSLPSRWLITAGREEPVADGSLGDHSPFANCLFAGLLAKKDSIFWVEELWTHLRKNIKWQGENQKPRGEPLPRTPHQGGQFVFMGRATNMYDVWESEKEKNEEQKD